MTKCDICIFGGGPAGSAMAKRLIEFGYSVVVIEKMPFPRSHVGISLSPGVEHWLKVLGVDVGVGVGMGAGMGVEKRLSPRSLLLWERNEVVEKEGGWHVDRGWFDQLLLNASGARVIFGNAYPIENIQGEWDVFIEQEQLFSARFLVVATGRRPLLKGRRRAILPVTVAAYARCSSSIETFIEAGESCWYWGGGGMGFVFADPGEVQRYNSVQAFFVDKMGRSQLMKPNNFGEVKMCTATAYVDESPVGKNFIKMGDAVFTMDPLSAQGVQKALKTAVQGAVVVNTILKGDAAAGIAFYENMVADEVSKHVKWTQQFYQSQSIYDSPFWEKRSKALFIEQDQVLKLSLDDLLITNPAAIVEQIPVLGKELIQYEHGIRIPGHEAPFVYVNEKPVVEMVHLLDRRTAKEGIQLLGMDLIRWLVYNRVMMKADQ
ncbi:tryptophan 7-halogenase [Chitinophaga sancti]|uniref:NAD(P)/FAD-dependent oxidoreductase n=1 Tax=Chitinophaga sancti TaxID=1004 RepID=UPI002A75C1BC|nr:tryptophan 7-halogenase [Chitinophaga sancti]WPQ63423.1 tryptophan 7-halogenase [Chitinophaga sancti]